MTNTSPTETTCKPNHTSSDVASDPGKGKRRQAYPWSVTQSANPEIGP